MSKATEGTITSPEPVWLSADGIQTVNTIELMKQKYDNIKRKSCV